MLRIRTELLFGLLALSTWSASAFMLASPQLKPTLFRQASLRGAAPFLLERSFSTCTSIHRMSERRYTIVASMNDRGVQSQSDEDLTLAEKAAKALEDAKAAEERAEALRASQLQMPKPSTQPPPAVALKTEDAEVVAEDPEKVAEEIASEIGKLQRSPGSPDPLSGTKWLLRLDLGREKGTWMDARWGASGSRVKAVVAIELEEAGKVKVIEDYNHGLMQQLPEVRGGTWRVAGSFPSERLKFQLEHGGLSAEQTKCDVDLPAGTLFLSANTLGTSLGKQGGLSIEQFRFYVRRERRMVGVFKAERLP